MSWWTLLRRRTRWAPAVTAGVVAVLALTALLVATVAVAGPAAVNAGLRDRLAQAPPGQRTVEITARWDETSPAPQDAAVRRLLADQLAPLRVDVQQLREGELLPLDGRTDRVVPWTGPDVQRHAVLTTGRWPAGGGATGPLEGALHATAAAALGVQPGDVLRPPPGRTGPPVTVVGLWAPRDLADPFWRGEPLALRGLQREGVRGPLVLDEASAARLPTDWTSRWRAAPDLTAVTPDLLAPIAASSAGLRVAAAGVPSGGGPTPTADSGISDLFGGMDAPLRAATGAARSLLLLLAAVAAALCLLVGSTLVQVRDVDDAVLRARGAGERGRLLLGLREGAVWALVAAVPVAALAPAAVAATVGPEAGTTTVAATVVAGAVAAFAAALLLVAVSTLGARRGARRRRGPGAREALPLRPSTLHVTAAAAAAAAWQLRSRGDVTPDDPVLVVAVAVLLTAASVIVVVVLSALARPLARLGSRGGPVTALATWHAGRRGWQPLAAVVVVVLSGAGAVCLLAAREAAREDRIASAHRQVAPVVAVAVPAPSGTPLQAGAGPAAEATRRLAALPGVAAVTPVLSIDASIGSGGTVRVLALDRDVLARMTAGAAPAVVPAASAALLGPSGSPSALTVNALLPAALLRSLATTTGQQVDTVDVAARPVRFLVAGTVDVPPADPFRADGTPVVLVDRADLERAEGAEPRPPEPDDPNLSPRAVWPLLPRTPRQWWVLPAPGADPAAVAQAALEAVQPLAAAGGPPAVVATRAGAEQQALAEPLTEGLGRLDVVGAVALVLAGSGALLLGQLGSTRRRRGELAVLRAVGLSVPQARRLALTESLLVGGAAVPAGVLLGVGVARWTTGQLNGLGSGPGDGLDAVAVAVVAGVLAVGVVVVAVVRARAAAAPGIAAVVREQAT